MKSQYAIKQPREGNLHKFLKALQLQLKTSERVAVVELLLNHLFRRACVLYIQMSLDLTMSTVFAIWSNRKLITLETEAG